jgi:hypothetical protein
MSSATVERCWLLYVGQGRFHHSGTDLRFHVIFTISVRVAGITDIRHRT